MEYSFVNYIWFFIIYSFLGWCIEVTFHGVTQGKFVNRGFLNGPVCPIYGFGMVILLYFLSPITDNLALLFIGSVVLTSTLEFITGFILEKFFQDKWWDYSDMPYNIKGYISLSFSLIWGLGAVFIINIIHPLINNFIPVFDNKIGSVILILFISYFLADFIVTLLGIFEISRQFKVLEEMAARLKLYSNGIGEDIYKSVNAFIKTGNKISEIEASLEKDLKITELKEKQREILEKKGFVRRRLEKSYPNINKSFLKFKDDHK